MGDEGMINGEMSITVLATGFETDFFSQDKKDSNAIRTKLPSKAVGLFKSKYENSYADIDMENYDEDLFDDDDEFDEEANEIQRRKLSKTVGPKRRKTRKGGIRGFFRRLF